MKRLLPLLSIAIIFFVCSCAKKTEINSLPTSVDSIDHPGPRVVTFAGSGTAGWVDGTKTLSSFTYPTGITINADGVMFIADKENNVVRAITPVGTISTLSGNGTLGFANGNPDKSEFAYPNAVAVDPSGNVYVADLQNNLVREVVSVTGVTSTYAGKSGFAGFANGGATSATFNGPNGIAIDASGNIYVSDVGNNVIRKIDLSGNVTTFAGTGGTGNVDGTSAQFNQPAGLAFDRSGNLYVADQGNNEIRKITPAGVVSTFAGNGTAGNVNATGTAATFNQPVGLAVDAGGYVYVADSYNNVIRKIDPNGTVTTLAGSGKLGYTDASLTAAAFAQPMGVCVDSSGNVFVSDTGNNVIREIFQ